VKLLLERDDVSPDKPDQTGFTPLSSAASKGYEGIVKSLLGWDDVSPNKPDEHGWTPLLGCFRWPQGSSENTARTGRHRP